MIINCKIFLLRQSRDLCRRILGADNVTFLVMNLTKSCQKKRLLARHGGEAAEGFTEQLGKMHDIFEQAREDEEGSYNVTITEDMTPDDVLNNVLEIIAKA